MVGKGGVSLLREIERTGSISKAAHNLGMSYKFAWDYVSKIREELGEVVSKRGRETGGSSLTPQLEMVLEIYEEAEVEVRNVLDKYEAKLKELIGDP
ncbi:hypothetical protein HS1genome_1349 [Sulfodiicoccus acidiphilus]|uniref:HTH lysR-type domain-containing protein n=1 Tax=Sulfodiicoccus acidiphilus TaxID=1670455 RepID=A0A348B458_9CREN|nr:LysR family transcriptional regulator [Sulfodiicoccus acidiphilus]BBD72960.1 hypothetical protein HS1genome_1349 [Sulfodiicoccus acidiphilus]